MWLGASKPLLPVQLMDTGVSKTKVAQTMTEAQRLGIARLLTRRVPAQ